MTRRSLIVGLFVLAVAACENPSAQGDEQASPSSNESTTSESATEGSAAGSDAEPREGPTPSEEPSEQAGSESAKKPDGGGAESFSPTLAKDGDHPPVVADRSPFADDYDLTKLAEQMQGNWGRIRCLARNLPAKLPPPAVESVLKSLRSRYSAVLD